MGIVIRQAGEEDFAAIYKLIKEFAVFQKTPEKVTITPEQMASDKDIFRCIVAVDESGEIIGYATYYYVYFSWSGKAGYLDDLYVTMPYRKQAVGKILLEKVAAICKENNCKKLRWQVSKWNKNAIEFYKAIGAVLDDTEMNCDLYF